MKYMTLVPLKFTNKELKPGDTFKPKDEEAIKELLAEGFIKPYCNWLEDVIENCQPPCFEGKAMTVIRECPHFKAYWQKRLKEINNHKVKN
jgi:hypothetical protein